jgi:hypothetical protein
VAGLGTDPGGGVPQGLTEVDRLDERRGGHPVIAPEPAPTQAAVLRSPRNASHTAPAATCPSGASTWSTASERRTA